MNSVITSKIFLITSYANKELPQISDRNKIQWIEFNKLQNEKEITIKEANKVSAVIIMDTSYNKHLLVSLLNNNEYYAEKTITTHRKSMKNLYSLIQAQRKDPTKEKQRKHFLANFKGKSGLFYGFSKIHKSPTIKEVIKTHRKHTCKHY